MAFIKYCENVSWLWLNWKGTIWSGSTPIKHYVLLVWLNCQHLFHKATRCIVFVQREGGAVVCIQGQPSLRLWVSSASQGSTSNKTIDCQRSQCSTRGALCLVSFVCVCLIQDAGDSVNLRQSLSIYGCMYSASFMNCQTSEIQQIVKKPRLFPRARETSSKDTNDFLVKWSWNKKLYKAAHPHVGEA